MRWHSKGGVCVGTIRGDICLPVRRLFYLGNFGGDLQIVYDNYFYVFHDFRGTPFLIGRNVGETASGHDKGGCLALASMPPPFERTGFLVFRFFSGEAPFVYLYVSMKAVVFTEMTQGCLAGTSVRILTIKIKQIQSCFLSISLHELSALSVPLEVLRHICS